MERDNKYQCRCTSWQVVLAPAGVLLRKDGQVIMSVATEKMSEVATKFAGYVERTINAMKDNSAQILTFHVTWE